VICTRKHVLAAHRNEVGLGRQGNGMRRFVVTRAIPGLRTAEDGFDCLYYSPRKACMGSIEAARPAGSAEATRASRNTTTAAIIMVTGVEGTHPKEEGAQEARSSGRSRQAKGTPDRG
jgi:hypothetical protein